ncbi:MAG: hypothetical protein H7Y59_04480 [Anaerolineales bacterium]|nr:hypothetical protein [Anaerolineales bacterium]
MVEKKIPYWWAALIGLLMPILQFVIFYIRFGNTNPDSSLLDYVLFFVAGTIGGLILIALLQRSKTKAARWLVLIAFILATPIALTGMIVGGLAGPIGVLFMSAMLWTIITSLGFLVGRFISRNA